MPSKKTKLIEIFYSYASIGNGVDEELQKQLEKHLGVLKRLGKINSWHKRNILAGQEINEEIQKHINTAQIILLLISPDFVASDNCWDIEMTRALERQKEEKTIVIPVLLRPLDYKDAPFSSLRVLPKNGKPVTSWSNQDEAFEDITRNIRLLIEQFEETGKISWRVLGTGIAFAAAISTLITGSTSNITKSAIIASSTAEVSAKDVPRPDPAPPLLGHVRSSLMSIQGIPVIELGKNASTWAVPIDKKVEFPLLVNCSIMNGWRDSILVGFVQLLIVHILPLPSFLPVGVPASIVSPYMSNMYRAIYQGQKEGETITATPVKSPFGYIQLRPREADILSIHVSSDTRAYVQFSIRIDYRSVNNPQTHLLTLPYLLTVAFLNASDLHEIKFSTPN